MASLEAALTHCSCAVDRDVISAAAAAGRAAACARLLLEAPRLTSNFDCPSATAAKSAHYDVMGVLLAAALATDDGGKRAACMAGLSRGACAGGQAGVLDWLAREHGHEGFSTFDVCVAARTAPDAGAGGAAAGPAGAAGQGQDADQQATQAAATAAAEQAEYGQPGEDAVLDGTLCALLTAAAASPTPCWAAKLHWLLRERWGPRVAGEVLAGDRGELFLVHSVWARPDFLDRLRHLHAAGLPRQHPVGGAAVYAAVHGHTAALEYLWDECGEAGPDDPEFIDDNVSGIGSRPGDMAVLELLRARGERFQLRHLALAAERRWPDASLLWLLEAAEDGDLGPAQVRACWSEAFSTAAAAGAGLQVLQALRSRGAAVDLEAVRLGGSAEAEEWAAAQEREELGNMMHVLQALYTVEDGG
ncbi:hypothetical protein HYH02_013024 [Chlamydomonas schloesseri]|uniref:Uncharacterized protein n=1 Tax=Chlamydomonas schloesseri TaxID=2026947 RepID=A0A835SVJ0_9CHLO|nr:hypothetical protein HYH02_013024 [Chlamydomonas schloesseri]|eukprot:KAG2432302.1 hypothetical protein HYH02_013024 [Chlamydomonas schloesseri]